MKCAIFGGGGFIGSAVVDRLVKDGHELKIFERPRVTPYRSFLPEEKVEWVRGDILSTHDVGDAIEGMDAVLHLVSTTLPKSSNDDPIFDVETNVIGTLQLLNAMVARNVKRMVFISSGGTVYGNPAYLPVDERHPTDPLVSYGVTKLAIEKYLLIFERTHGIKSIVLRVANPYGERQRIETAQGAVGVFLHNAIKDIPLDIWGDGSVTRDYVHVSDVAEAFVLALGYAGEKRVFNISSGVGVSLSELVAMLEDTLGRPVVRRHLPGRPFDVQVSVLSNGLAREELKWSPRISMREGIARTARWMIKEWGPTEMDAARR
jgi:UDP-glucose 4-epimerase